ncbi:MAG: pilus assembly protein TadG-related protein [Chloroflexi bacterium]|nr:pilus assembly protein TadG-related protein [Chloroflexota bacterium]
MLTRQERQGGQIIVVFVLSIVVVIGMVGLVIDGGSVYAQQRGQQNAADLAALAGADALLNGRSQTQATTIAQGVAATNGYSNGVNGATVTVTYPTNTIKVDIGAPHQNYFSGIYGQPTWQVGVTASALSGTPDTASGAAPFIMPISDFGSDGQPLSKYLQASCSETNGDGNTGCVWGNINGDVPANSTDWAWTLYGENVNTSTVDAYLEGFCTGTTVDTTQTIAAGTNPYWGQHNMGMHNGGFKFADCIVGKDVAVPIVGPPLPPSTTCTDSTETDGCFMGWAMFHVTGYDKHGTQSHWDGWFLPGGIQYPSLSVQNCEGSSCPILGKPVLKLVN